MAGIDTAAGVLSARRFAAYVRITVALIGVLILAFEPSTVTHAGAAAIGLAVIGITGLIELSVRHERWLAYEEAFSCTAAVLIVAVGGGEVNPITLLWLVAAATGVLARGGRVGGAGRILVVGALLAPLVIEGPSFERAGLAAGSIMMLIAVGRISRQTGDLLEKAKYAAEHDRLTDLLSRERFHELVDDAAGELREGDQAALVAIDLDDFGAINKRHGTAVADGLLVSVGAALREAMDSQALLGRIGGRELAVFAETSDPEELVRRILAAISGSSSDIKLTAHAGYALCPDDADTADGLSTGAEVALRVAKLSANTSSAAYRGARLSDAGDGARSMLERLCRGEGLAMAAQPIVSFEDGTTHAYEALARFEAEGGGGPLQWFALAEEFGMRAELELACLRKALELLPDAPGETRLSVNLSAPLLSDQRTAELLAATPDLTRLIVEVTENALVSNEPVLDRVIFELRGRGVAFAVDDIGAGYAGLAQLAALQPRYLKIDRALITGIDRDPARASLVHLLAEYGREHDGLVVAEGIENESELAVVKEAGVSLGQGFLLARPGPPWPAVADVGSRSERNVAASARETDVAVA